MSIRIKCPACKSTITVGEDHRGRKVRCRECEKVFSVPEKSGTKERDEETAVQAGRKAKALPRKPDDDDDATPVERKKKSAKGNTGTLMAVGGVAAALLVCLIGGGGIGAYFIFRSKPADQQVAQNDGKKNEDNRDDKDTPKKVKNDPDKDKVADPNKDKKGGPPVDPDAGKPLPGQLAPEMLAKVKQATVYLRVTMPSGQIAEGSGFFAMERRIIVTNAHVLGMLGAASKPPKQVDVVQDSGLATENRMVGDVLGVDRASDLAIVRVPDNPKLPAPLRMATGAPTELQKVYILGFPFGEKLGKNITISEQAITSLRPDALGELEQIQVNGGMNPGNSGGPVVNTRGDLVGVSVSIITGAQISFAVPAEKVHRVMEGRIADLHYGEAFQQQGQARLPVRLMCLEPLNRIQNMRVEVWAGPSGAIRPPTGQKPQGLPGDSPRQVHVVKYVNGVGTVEVPLPALPMGQVFWVQPVVLSANGERWSSAHPTPADFAVLERKAVDLIINLDKHKERTARIENRFTIIEALGKKESKVVQHTTVELLEVLQEPAIANGKKTVHIKTAFGQVNVNLNVNNKPVKFGRDDLDALAISRGMPPTFIIDDTDATASYIKVSINPKHPKYYLKDDVEEFNGMINNPFEATQIKMPNRRIQPQQTFEAQSTMMMRFGSGSGPQPKGKGPQRATIHDLKMNCTLEGVRVRNGREEAILSVVGALQTRESVRTLGDITGRIGFDVAGGFVSFVKLKIYAEDEENIPGLGTLRESVSQDVDMDRVPGNTKNLALQQEKKGPDLSKPIPSPAKGKVLYSQKSMLAANDTLDPTVKGAAIRMKVFPVQLKASTTYVISMDSAAFDAFLRLEDAAGKQVAADDDSGGALNARIVYRPTQTGQFRIVATSFKANSVGAFQLTVQELGGP